MPKCVFYCVDNNPCKSCWQGVLRREIDGRKDEFIYILQGCPTLHTNEGATLLEPGMCAGFPAGTGNAANLSNGTDSEVVYLEIGDRTAGDEASYPDDDLQAVLADGNWQFTHKDGAPYA